MRSIFPQIKEKFLKDLVLRKSWEMYMIDQFLGDDFGVLSCPFWSSVLQRSAIHTLNYRTDRVVSGARFITGVYLSVTMLIIDLWQYSVYCIRSCVTRCTLLMGLYLGRMCEFGLHAVLWLHIGILTRCLAVKPCSTDGLLFPSQCPSGTILRIPYSIVFDWRVSRAGPMLFHWPKL